MCSMRIYNSLFVFLSNLSHPVFSQPPFCRQQWFIVKTHYGLLMLAKSVEQFYWKLSPPKKSFRFPQADHTHSYTFYRIWIIPRKALTMLTVASATCFIWNWIVSLNTACWNTTPSGANGFSEDKRRWMTGIRNELIIFQAVRGKLSLCTLPLILVVFY